MSKKRILRKDGIYHAYNRGNDKMVIFPQAVDKLMFLKKLKELQIMYGFEVYAYCMMDTHYHLMIKDNSINLPKIMNSLQDYYAQYFNAKYNHSGHVFEGPFKSNLIIYFFGFFRLYRYIQRNPVAAHMSKSITAYPWVSADLHHDTFGLVNFKYVYSYYKEHGKVPLDEFLSDPSDDNLISEIEVQQVDDNEANAIFISILKSYSINEEISLNELNTTQKEQVISKARYLGISCRQLSFITGYSKYMITKLSKNKDWDYI